MYINGKFYDIRIVVMALSGVFFILNGWLSAFVPNWLAGPILCQGIVCVTAFVSCIISFIFIELKTEP